MWENHQVREKVAMAHSISRRRVVQGLGMGVAAAALRRLPLSAGGGRALRAVTVNHISYQVDDYRKVRDFYADLLGMTVSHDDGKQCYLAFGNSFLIARNKTTDTTKAPLIDHIAYTIADWDTDAVAKALTERGLTPKPDTEHSFHVKDPDGFDLQIAGAKMTPDYWPKTTPPASAGTPPAGPGKFKAVTVNHISYQSSNFEKTRDFYADVLGMTVWSHTSHTGEKQTWLGFGDSYIIPRTSRRVEIKPPLVDHIAFTIENWTTAAVEAELKRRDLNPRPDTDDSFIVTDPGGFMLQISGSNMKP